MVVEPIAARRTAGVVTIYVLTFLLFGLLAIYAAGLYLGFLSRWGLFSGALAFPAASFALALVVAAALSFLAWRQRARDRGVLKGTLAAIIAAALLFAASLVFTPSLVEVEDVPSPEAGDLRVLTWNVRQGDEDASSRAQLVESLDPDVVVFNELYEGNLGPGDVPGGYTAVGARGIAVTVLVKDGLPPYRVSKIDDSGATSGFLLVSSEPSVAPNILAVHLTRLTLLGGTELRDFGLDWVAAGCSGSNTIAVGDFNAVPANMPHGRLGECAAVDRFAPSWPATVPAPFGAAIDNVLATSDWHANRAVTLDIPNMRTDHRPVMADLRRGSLP